jgi:azurin
VIEKTKLKNMKNLSLTIALLTLILISCGGNKKPDEQQNTSPGSELMKEEPRYNPSNINPSAPVVEITLRAMGNTMADMSFDRTELKVKAGSTVKLTLINESTDESMQHNFVLIKDSTEEKVGMEGVKAGAGKNFIPSIPEVLVGTRMLHPKEKATIIFPSPVKGTYMFICTYPGHYTRMIGKFFVD